jgi:hypothetical protein
MYNILRTKPIGRATSAAVGTTGVAFTNPNTTINPQQVSIYVSALAYVGFGTAASPPTASTSNSVSQESGTTVVYTLNGVPVLDGAYLYVYADSGTITTRINWFG